MSYEPVTIWKSPALNLVGCRIGEERRRCRCEMDAEGQSSCPFVDGQVAGHVEVAGEPVEMRFSLRSSIHSTGRPISKLAAVATT